MAVIKPMVRSSMCINSHPVGCVKDTERQIAYVKSQKAKRGIKTLKEGGKGHDLVLVLGCSTGYGLASRISAAFEYGADTIGVSFEKEGTEKKFGTPGWYNNMAFDAEAKKAGLFSTTLNGDAYSDEVKAEVIKLAKEHNMKFDLVVYSLASPVRTDPDTKVLYRSVIKPIGKDFSGVTFDTMTGEMKEITAEAANEEEIANTVKVMGGEDWERCINQMMKADVLADGCMTVAYSYVFAMVEVYTVAIANFQVVKQVYTINYSTIASNKMHSPIGTIADGNIADSKIVYTKECKHMWTRIEGCYRFKLVRIVQLLTHKGNTITMDSSLTRNRYILSILGVYPHHAFTSILAKSA